MRGSPALGRAPEDPGWPWASVKPSVNDIYQNSDDALRWFNDTYRARFRMTPYQREHLGLMGRFVFPYELLDEAARTRLVVFAEALWQSVRSKTWAGDPDVELLAIALRDCVIRGEMETAARSLFPDTDALATTLAGGDPEGERVQQIRGLDAPEGADEQVSEYWIEKARSWRLGALGVNDLTRRTMRLGPEQAVREIWGAARQTRHNRGSTAGRSPRPRAAVVTASAGCLWSATALLLAVVLQARVHVGGGPDVGR